MATDPAQKAAILAAKIAAEVVRAAGKGLNAARLFLQARLVETMSVTGNPKRVKTATGEIYYRATTPATRGAPIRKVSGRAVKSVTSLMVSPLEATLGVSAVSDKGFRYPAYHEIVDPARPGSGQHAFIRPTVEKYINDLGTIVGGQVIVVMQQSGGG